MPKAGRYEYPTRPLDDCIDYLKRAHEGLKTYVMKRETFGEALKMAPRGGGFGSITGSLIYYGLIETGDGNIRYTELAKKILHGELEEQEQAKAQAARNVELFAEVYDRYGANFTDEQLRIFLREKAVVDISEAGHLALEIGKILKKVVLYLRPVQTNRTNNVDTTLGSIENAPKTIAGKDAAIIPNTETWESNDFGVWVKRDPSAIDFCLTQMESIKAWLNYVKKKCETAPKVTEEVTA
jgi:hypothetical protein